MVDMDAKHVAQERFGKYAASYTAPWHNAAGPDLELIARLVGDHPLWVALDIATGGGHTALAVAPHVARVVATDITAPMLGAAREFVLSRGAGNIDFALADAEDLPFPACSFDLVTCRIAAHHFPDPARFVLVEAYRTPQAPAAHKETAHYARWRDTVAPMMAGPRTSVKYANVFPADAGW